MAGESVVEQAGGRSEEQLAGAAEQDGFLWEELSEREGLRDVEPAGIGGKVLLVETVQVRGQAFSADHPVGGATRNLRLSTWSVPVVGSDDSGAGLGALEGELCLGLAGGRGGQLQQVPVDAADGVAHPFVEIRVGELAEQELYGGLRLLLLAIRHGLFGLCDADLVSRHRLLCSGYLNVVGRGRLLNPPLLAA